MMNLIELQSILMEAKNKGKILGWRIVRDEGSKVVISIDFVNNDVISTRTYVIRVINRGSSDEAIFWEGARPSGLFEEESNQPKIPDDVIEKIKQDLQANYGVTIFENVSKNEQAMLVNIDAYVPDPNNANAVLKKRYVAYITKNNDGTYSYKIFEVVS